MKKLTQNLLRTSLFALLALAASACGQKGPLEVEQPNKTQEEEQAQTR